jgi:hypothetical protein
MHDASRRESAGSGDGGGEVVEDPLEVGPPAGRGEVSTRPRQQKAVDDAGGMMAAVDS